jgi:hypothetical protein
LKSRQESGCSFSRGGEGDANTEVRSLSHGERVGVRGYGLPLVLTPHPALHADLPHRER